MRPVTVSVTGPGVTPPVPLDLYLTPFNVSLAAINPSGATYTVEWTQDDIWSPSFNPATANWFPGPANMVAAIDTETGTLISPVRAVRLRQTLGAGTTQLQVVQAGDGRIMEKLAPFIAGLLAAVGLAVLAQNGGGVNGGGGGAGSPGGATNAAQYKATATTFGGISLAAGQALMGTATTPQATSVPNCGSSTQALAYSTGAHTYSCQTISPSGVATVVMKTATTTRTSTTTATIDPDLQFTSVPAGNHTLHCNITVGVGATGATPGFKLVPQVSNPGTTPQFLTLGSSNGSIAVFSGNADGVTALGFSPASTTSVYNIDVGWVASAGSGTVGLLWAQQTSSATATSINLNSYCQLT